MQNLHLQQKDWNNILDHISRSENSHKVTIEIVREDLGAQKEVENVTLHGISYDPKGAAIAIRAGGCRAYDSPPGRIRSRMRHGSDLP